MVKKTGVIILNYNNSQDTINCINSFLAVNKEPYKIVVVDNGSRKEKFDVIKSFLEDKNCKLYEDSSSFEDIHSNDFCLIVSKNNLGYANGNNLGISLLKNDKEIDKLLIVNNDVLFVDNIIKDLRAFEQEHNDAGIISPILYTKGLKDFDYTCARKSPKDWILLFKYLFMDLATFHMSEWIDSCCFLLKENPDIIYNDSIKVDLPSGSCMFIDKELFCSIDCFDSNTFLYYEENILYKKLYAIGKQNYILPSIRCIHLGASSTKSKPSSFLIKCNSDSAFYYLENYCELNVVQKFLLVLAKKSMKIKYKLFKNREK